MSEQNLIELNEKPQIWLGVLGKERAVDIVRVVSKYASSLVLFEVSNLVVVLSNSDH